MRPSLQPPPSPPPTVALPKAALTPAKAALVVADIMEHDLGADNGMRVYNVVHPRPTPWSDVLDTVKKWCGEGTQVVILREWVRNLNRLDASDPRVLDRFPALRMSTHDYKMGNSMEASKNLFELPAINEELMGMWLKELLV
ncbi:hypothetical protein BGZ57DRAFT_913858 [Hyaloscypha finlandica]|nr:hypothetical protein BGZ57DRAFT_913858 [Hyaloscypha finlandica]